MEAASVSAGPIEVITVFSPAIPTIQLEKDMPVAVEILDSERLDELPAVNAIEALQSIPGLSITSQVQGQRGAVRIDGLPPEFTELLVNGQRYAGETDEAIDLGDLLFANVDRIEILRGPQALRYSARAAGGVINLITKDPPTDGPGLDAMIANGDQETTSGELTVGFGKPTLGGNLVYDYNQQGGFNAPHPESSDFDDGLASPFGEGSLYRTHDLYSTAVARPTAALELTTHLGYRIRDDSFAIDNGPTTGRRENQRWLVSEDARFEFNAVTHGFGTLTYSNDSLDSSVGRDYKLGDDLGRLQLGIERIVDIGSTAHTVTVATDLATTGIDLKEGPIPDNIDLEPGEVDERSYRGGLYAIVDSELFDWLSSEVGIRREMHSRFAPAWLPQAAVLVTPYRWDETRAIKLRFSAGRAIRYPALRELYQPPTPQLGGAYFLAGNRDLAPEKVWSARAGIEVNPTRWLETSVTGFYSRTKNYIRAQYQGQNIQIGEQVIPANPVLCQLGIIEWCTDRVVPITSAVYQKANLDDLESYGLEARLELKPHELVDIQLGYTWNRSLVEDSNIQLDRLPNAPEHVANGAVTLTAPITDTTLTARGQWRSHALIERTGTGSGSFATGEESNSSFTLDMRLRQPLEQWLGRNVELFTDVNNVTDNRVIDSYVVRGRQFLIGIRGRFP